MAPEPPTSSAGTFGRVLEALASARTCRIVTFGRRSGEPHVVTVWFAVDGTTVFAPCRHGEASDWLRNAVAAGAVEVVTRRSTWPGRAHLVVDPDEVRRGAEALAAKYRGSGSFVASWIDAPPTMAAIELVVDS